MSGPTPLEHPIGKFESARVGYVHGLEEERADAFSPANPNFKELDTSSSLSRYSAYIVLAYLAIGTAFFSWSEEWDWDDSLYYCIVTMTTVGFGDLVPSNDISKIFAVIYIVFGLSFGATALGLVVAHVQSHVDALLHQQPRAHRHWWQVATSLATIFVLIGIGAVFVSYSEGWGAVDSVYWAVVASSSVGYGDLELKAQFSRWFSTPYLLAAVGGFAVSLSKFGSIIMEVEAERAINDFVARGVSMAMIEEMDADGSGSVDRSEFLRYMLISMGKVDPEDLDKIVGMFDQLDADGSGAIDRDDILRELSRRSSGRTAASSPSPSERGGGRPAARLAKKGERPWFAEMTSAGSQALKALAKPLLP